MHERYDFPEGIINVSMGEGGGEYLICGNEKVALYDVGMAHSGKKLVFKIEQELEKLGRDKLDSVLISHSHYDHVGALGYILRRWPGALVYGTAKTKAVFESKNARDFMMVMAENARNIHGDPNEQLYMDGMRVDVTVGDGEIIGLGGRHLKVLETKGHTDCSLTYILEPYNIMFASESTGVYVSMGNINPAILKSYLQVKESLKKCKEAAPKSIISPHYGLVPENQVCSFFDIAEMYVDKTKEIVCRLIQEGRTDEEIYEVYEAFFWPLHKGTVKKGFMTNGKLCIKSIRKELFPE
ncbi:MAG: MBL fold metallo-hydrolase [Eubacteriales bacterium]|nr:MBL fold metallo-hydrolase [Eubacteriales bacterium]MDD4389633.1 MBL fold metallo-hydrolase [Eubacteriales bacterium]